MLCLNMRPCHRPRMRAWPYCHKRSSVLVNWISFVHPFLSAPPGEHIRDLVLDTSNAVYQYKQIDNLPRNRPRWMATADDGMQRTLSLHRSSATRHLHADHGRRIFIGTCGRTDNGEHDTIGNDSFLNPRSRDAQSFVIGGHGWSGSSWHLLSPGPVL